MMKHGDAVHHREMRGVFAPVGDRLRADPDTRGAADHEIIAVVNVRVRIAGESMRCTDDFEQLAESVSPVRIIDGLIDVNAQSAVAAT